MSYQEEFYSNYYSTHIQPRKGKPSINSFRSGTKYFRKRWYQLLPTERSSEILDIGCGYGHLVWWLQDSGFSNVSGIDVSAEQIAVAHEMGIENVEVADLVSFLSTRPHQYDVLILRDVIEHFPKNEVVQIMKLCNASLKLGGRVIVQVPNAESPFFTRVRYGDFTHELTFTSTSLRQLLSVCSFTNISFYPTTMVARGLRSFFALVARRTIELIYGLFFWLATKFRPTILSEGIIVLAFKQ